MSQFVTYNIMVPNQFSTLDIMFSQCSVVLSKRTSNSVIIPIISYFCSDSSGDKRDTKPLSLSPLQVSYWVLNIIQFTSLVEVGSKLYITAYMKSFLFRLGLLVTKLKYFIGVIEPPHFNTLHLNFTNKPNFTKMTQLVTMLYPIPISL